MSGGWSRSLGGLCQSAIVLRNNFVYVGTDDGVLHAISMSDGRRAWTYRAGVPAVVAPVVERGKVWLAVAGGGVEAADAFTGRRLWRHRAVAGGTAPISSLLYPGPAWLGARLFTLDGRQLVAISKTSGKTLDSLRLPDGDLTYPVATDRAVVVGVDRTIYSVAPSLNRTLWRLNLGDEGPVTPVFAGGRIFTGTRRGSVFAIDAANGRMSWRYNSLPAAVAGVASDGMQLFVVSVTGNIYAFDAISGRLSWRFDTGGGLASPPVVSGASVLFGSNEGRIYSVSAEDGQFEWSYETADSYPISLGVQDDVTYFAANSPAGNEGTTRLVAFDIGATLAGLRAFNEGPMTGRRPEQDTVSAVLVDSVVAAAARAGPRGGVFAGVGWPYRFLSAVGNPSVLVRGSAGTSSTKSAEALAVSAGVMGLTAGVTSLAAFLLLFVCSAIGFAVAPRSIPILGAVRGGEEIGAVQPGLWRDSVRLVGRCRWSIGVVAAAELVAIPTLVLIRLVAGPADQVWAFMGWAGLVSTIILLTTSFCRSLLLRGMSAVRRGETPSSSRYVPRVRVVYRVITLNVVASILLALAFFLVDLSGALSSRWLLLPAMMCAVLPAPALLADCFVAADDESVPRSLAMAVRTMVRQPMGFGNYCLAAVAALLVPAAVGGWTSGAAGGFVVGLLFYPVASAFLAAMCVEICAAEGSLYNKQAD